MSDPYNTPNTQQPQQPFQPQQPMMPQQTDGFAITALVLGILGLLLTCYLGVILAIPAVIFGHLSMGKIKRNPALGGKGMATAGVVCGYVSIGITIILAIISLTAGASIMDEIEKQQQLQKTEGYEFPATPSSGN